MASASFAPIPGLPTPGVLIAGKYLLEQELGRGGFGAVFRATNQNTGRVVALKWMLPELAEDATSIARFLQEARSISRLDHENVVSVLDVDRDASGGFYMVMELLRGETLGSRLERSPMSAAELASVMSQVCDGLHAAHASGIVHRDLKPDNIFLAEPRGGGRADFVAKILDFGISKVDDVSTSRRRTANGVAMGTPHYMSPEQIRSTRDVDYRTDIYSLGVIAYEALSGTVPFQGQEAVAILAQALSDEAPALSTRAPGISPRVTEVVAQAMAKDPSRRFSSALDFSFALMSAATAPEVPRPPAATPLVIAAQIDAAIAPPQRALQVTSKPEAIFDEVEPSVPPMFSSGVVVAMSAVTALFFLACGAAWVAMSSDDEEPVPSTPQVNVAPIVAPVELRLRTDVAAGHLFVDGEDYGPVTQGADVQLELPPGPHRTEIRVDGTSVVTSEVTLVAGIPGDVMLSDPRLPSFGSATISPVLENTTPTPNTRRREQPEPGPSEPATEADPPLDASVVQAVVTENRRRLQRCYESNDRNSFDGQRVRMDVNSTVGRSGAVTAVTVTNYIPEAAAVANCIERDVAGWRFPASSDGGNIRFPVVFSTTPPATPVPPASADEDAPESP